MKAAFCNVALLVDDIEKVAGFYVDVLGFRRREAKGWPDNEQHLSDANWTAVYLGRLGIELFRAAEHNVTGEALPGRPRGGFVIGIFTEDLDAKLEVVRQKGGRIASRPDVIERSWGRYALVEDPEGNLVELSQLAQEEEMWVETSGPWVVDDGLRAAS